MTGTSARLPQKTFADSSFLTQLFAALEAESPRHVGQDVQTFKELGRMHPYKRSPIRQRAGLRAALGAAALAALCAIGNSAQGAAFTWNGGAAGTGSLNWSTTANWVNGSKPTSSS